VLLQQFRIAQLVLPAVEFCDLVQGLLVLVEAVPPAVPLGDVLLQRKRHELRQFVQREGFRGERHQSLLELD